MSSAGLRVKMTTTERMATSAKTTRSSMRVNDSLLSFPRRRESILVFLRGKPNLDCPIKLDNDKWVVLFLIRIFVNIRNFVIIYCLTLLKNDNASADSANGISIYTLSMFV